MRTCTSQGSFHPYFHFPVPEQILLGRQTTCQRRCAKPSRMLFLLEKVGKKTGRPHISNRWNKREGGVRNVGVDSWVL